ncbi:MAG: hypothetical protein KDC57_04050 [Saprospiraceae bacterium]|nr:hypothetical protein [Saprospiraceae bacterium]
MVLNKIFGNSRRNYLSDNKLAKYLKYATGEIVLVVIGILIALQVNNWNTNRIERNDEQKLLQQVKNEFQLNDNQLLEKIERRKNELLSVLNILQIIDAKRLTQEQTKLDSLLASAISVFTFDPVNGIMNQLIQAGKLSLIRNDSLSNMLSNWDGILADYKENENNYLDFNNKNLRPFLYEHFNYRNIINNRIIHNDISYPLMDERYQYGNEIGNSDLKMSEPDAQVIKKLENQMASVISHLSYLNAQSYGIHDYINRIITAIDRELNKS